MRLYVLTLPRGIQTRANATVQQAEAQSSILGGDTGAVDSLGAEPTERPLTLEYPDTLATIRAAEVRELAAGFEQPVPFHGKPATTRDDGYYTVSEGSPSPLDPRTQDIQQVRVRLSREGSLAESYREVRTEPAQADHPFGSTTEAPVGVPAQARKVRWFDAATGDREVPTVQTTRTAELGDVDIYDARASSFTAPEILFELEYSDEGPVDVRVWDDRGNADRTNTDGALQWQKVFAPSHRFDGVPIVSSGKLRIALDESTNTLSAETYSSGSWSATALGGGDWELFQFDIRQISPTQAGGKIEFRDTTQSPTAFHTLTVQLARGAEAVLFSAGDPIPSGLETRLSPIAADHIYDPYGSLRATPQGLIAKAEVL